jgi:predicted RNA-binding Zn ribbon-like protein
MPSIPERRPTNGPGFVFVGEHPAIDFANTLLMLDGRETDRLQAWADVIDWLSLAGLSVDPGLKLPAPLGAEALKSVLELRQAWKAELVRLISGSKLSDAFIARLNRLLANDTYHEELHRDGSRIVHLERSHSLLHGAQLAHALLGRQIAVFLAEANLSYLRRCANTTSCGLYFYDTTKNHRRQWCSVAVCGNRHKVAQFRQRQTKAKG